MRENVLRTLEELRQNKVIGKALEADVVLYASHATFDLLHKNGSSLKKEFFNVSDVQLHKLIPGQALETHIATEVATNIANLRAFVKSASGYKCARCWNFMPEVSNYGIWENVCTRCQGTLKEMGIEPPEPLEAAS
jgi:isoleucyl-tRNA synthetase